MGSLRESRKKERKRKDELGNLLLNFLGMATWSQRRRPIVASYSKCDNRKLAINNRDANLSQQGHEKAPGWIKTKTGRKGNAQTHFSHFVAASQFRHPLLSYSVPIRKPTSIDV